VAENNRMTLEEFIIQLVWTYGNIVYGPRPSVPDKATADFCMRKDDTPAIIDN